MRIFIIICLAMATSSLAFGFDPTSDIALTDICKIVHHPLTDATYAQRGRLRGIKVEAWKSRLNPLLKIYKENWLKICDKTDDASFFNIFDLYPKVINALFSASNAPNFAVPDDFAEDWDYKQVATTLPFVNYSPRSGNANAFDFVFDMKAYFAFVERWGKMDDKIFSYVKTNVSGLDPEPLWRLSAGGYRKTCTKFGEYKWFAAFELIKKSEKYFTTSYKTQMAKIRNDLIRVFDAGVFNDICACGSLDTVRPDFETLRVKAGTDPYYTDLVKAIQYSQSRMNEKEFHFGSFLGNSCAAGSN